MRLTKIRMDFNTSSLVDIGVGGVGEALGLSTKLNLKDNIRK